MKAKGGGFIELLRLAAVRDVMTSTSAGNPLPDLPAPGLCLAACLGDDPDATPPPAVTTTAPLILAVLHPRSSVAWLWQRDSWQRLDSAEPLANGGRFGLRLALAASQLGLATSQSSAELTALAMPFDHQLSPDELSAELARSPSRRFLIAAVGWCGGQWHDGPLLHARDQRVLSYLPSGGAGGLGVPVADRNDAASGVSCHAALALEGSLGDQARRCLVAAMADLIGRGERQAAPGSAELKVVSEASQLGLADAVTLALLREARPGLGMELVCAAPMEPPMRRLCQNLEIRIRSAVQDTDATGSGARRQGTLRITLLEARRVISSPLVQPLAEAFCTASDVIPLGLRRPHS